MNYFLILILLLSYTLKGDFMITISLCMIVKNEEKVLKRILEDVKDVVDEIIIVDTGSTDKTKEIASTYTNLIYDFKWVDDFSKARNYSFSKATKDYIMWLDADDRLLSKDKKKLIDLKKKLNTSTDIVMMKYVTLLDENNNPAFSYYRERLLKREKEYKWVSPVHEVIVPSGNILYSDIEILHQKESKEYTDRNLKIFESMLAKNEVLDSRQLYYYSRELMYHKKYDKAILNYNNLLKRDDVWIENRINTYLDLAFCYLCTGNKSMYLPTLFSSFEYDTPRAEITTTISLYFLDNEKYKEAIFWSKVSLSIEKNINSGAFIQEDYYNFIPYLILTYACDKLGNHEEAKKYNDLAGTLKPNNVQYLHNKKYFENLSHN